MEKMISTQIADITSKSSSPPSANSDVISMATPTSFPRIKRPPRFPRGERWSCLEQLVDQQVRENDPGKRHAFDERGGDDHVGADGATGVGLTADAFNRLAADLA